MAKRRQKRKKVRMEFRPNVQNPVREGSWLWTKKLKDQRDDVDETVGGEAVKGKGKLARKRTVDLARAGDLVDLERRAQEPAAQESEWKQGTVVAIHGHFVAVDDGIRRRNCVIRRVLKSLLVDQRNVASVGDTVYFTPSGEDEGVIERIGERHGTLYRRLRNREHLIVSNVDQVVIVASVALPELRIHLVDRYIVAALAGELAPVIVFNKIDLPHDYPLDEYERVYTSLGYSVMKTSVVTGVGLDDLRKVMRDRKSVLAGVSGVGKSSLINALEPGLRLAVKPVNRTTGRGQHTTSAVSLLKLSFGGYVVDTPGIRQFAFWNIDRLNLEAYFEEFLPYIPECKFPDCTHIHETDCAVKQAIEAGNIAPWRYNSYVKTFDDQKEFMSPWER